MIFVTGMDDDTASYREIVEELTKLYGGKIAPFHMPIRQDQRLIGYADITKMSARKFTGIGKYEDFEIPDYDVRWHPVLLKPFSVLLLV